MNKVDVPISKGLDLPIAGAPDQRVAEETSVHAVGLIADDYIGMKPTMHVAEGDRVKLGQLLFEDKKTQGIRYVAPAAGRVISVHRGAKRKLESVAIEVDGDDAESFASFPHTNLHSLDRDAAKANLLSSGLWTALRTRPYSKVPDPQSAPHSLFVTAIDTNPLCPDPATVLDLPDYERYFVQGLQVLTTLTDGPLFLCKKQGSDIPGTQVEGVTVAEFHGPHPAGLPGTHIHFLDPVNELKTVWHIGYQDVVAIGCLFVNGQLMHDRVVAVAGPAAQPPRIVRTRLGAAVADLTAASMSDSAEASVRVISGSVLSGRIASAPRDFLGRFHNQISLVAEDKRRELLGWALPGSKKFSVTRAFASAFSRNGKPVSFTTSTQGSRRAIIPIGTYEQVMPLDIVATELLKSLIVQDTESAQTLGCLELDEEDLALCTFACPGKNEYGPMLRQCLTHIEREG